MRYSVKYLFAVILAVAVFCAAAVRMPGLTFLVASFVPLYFAGRFALRTQRDPTWLVTAILILALLPAFAAVGPPLCFGSS